MLGDVRAVRTYVDADGVGWLVLSDGARVRLPAGGTGPEGPPGPTERHILAGYIARHFVPDAAAWAMRDAGTILLTRVVGTKLSVVGGNIVVGAGVSYVTVSAHCAGMSKTPTGDKVLNLRVNGTKDHMFSYAAMTSAAMPWTPVAMSTALVAVVEGDVIDLGIEVGATGTCEMLETWISVEVVA